MQISDRKRGKTREHSEVCGDVGKARTERRTFALKIIALVAEGVYLAGEEVELGTDGVKGLVHASMSVLDLGGGADAWWPRLVVGAGGLEVFVLLEGG